MRRLVATLALTALLPTLAIAAFTGPSELLFAESWKNQPFDAAYEVHANLQDTYFASLWVRGSGQKVEGGFSKGTATMTLDIAGPQFTVRSKWQVRVANGYAYVLLERIEGNADHPLATLAASITGKHWLSFPLSEVEEETTEIHTMARELVDAILILTQKPAGAGTQYTLTLNKEPSEQLGDFLGVVGDEDMLRSILASSTFQIDARADAHDRVQSLSHSLSFTVKEVSIRSTGTVTLRTKPLTIESPADSLSLEEVQAMLEWPLPSFWTDDVMPDMSDWEPSEPDTSWDDPCASDDPVKHLSAVRVGACSDAGRPSRRSLNRY